MGEEKDASELGKLHAVQSESQEIGMFLDWCMAKGYTLCSQVRPDAENDYQRHLPVMMTIPQLLALYFEIDLDKADRERELLLEAWRIGQQQAAL